MSSKISWLVAGVIGVLALSRGYCYEIKGMDLTPLAGVSMTYDDNITYSKDDKEDDFITAITLGLKAKREALTYSWEAAGNITPEFFARHNKFNKTSEEFLFSFNKDLTKRDRVSLTESFLHGYEPKTFAQAFGRTLGRYSYYVNKFAMEYAKELSSQWTVKAAYGNEFYAFSAQDSADSYLNTLRLEGGYALSSYTSLLFLYSFSARSFDPGENAFKNSLAAGFTHFLTTQLSCRAQAGIDFIESYGNKRYTKPMFLVSLKDEINQNVSAKLSLTKEYSLNPYMQDVFDNWEVSASLDALLIKRLLSRFSAFYGKGDYVASHITDRLGGAGAGLSYEVKKDMKLDVDYSYTRVISNDDSREFDKNSASCALKMEF